MRNRRSEDCHEISTSPSSLSPMGLPRTRSDCIFRDSGARHLDLHTAANHRKHPSNPCNMVNLGISFGFHSFAAMVHIGL